MIKASTIGYTGFQIADFAAVLQSHCVECLVDIRELPLSRKPGFSKSSLSETLESHGIDYLHLRELGSPRSLRHAVRGDGDYAAFFRGMRRHLATRVARDAVDHVVERIRRERCCVMCCCADWNFCHRSAVVDAINRKVVVSFEHIAHNTGEVPKRRAA
jgi:uncharacterized protein (DUF488 family)